MARDEPELFARSCALEDVLNTRRAELGCDPVYLTRFGAPLAHAITAAQDTLPGLETSADSDSGDGGWCDNGACFT